MYVISTRLSPALWCRWGGGGGGGGGGMGRWHPDPLDPPMLWPPQTMNLQPMVFCRYKYIDTTYLRRDIYLYSE